MFIFGRGCCVVFVRQMEEIGVRVKKGAGWGEKRTDEIVQLAEHKK